MNANEMFKELGYKKELHISYIIYFKKIKQNCCDDIKEYSIWFYQDSESFEKIGGLIILEELQAINKKVEELGWLEGDNK